VRCGCCQAKEGYWLRISSLLLLGILYGNEKMEGKRRNRTKKNEREKEFGRKSFEFEPVKSAPNEKP
jgi:hypothetical protein